MDPEKTFITLSTHNVNGFSRSKSFLHSQCESAPNSIRGIQEHWLRPSFKKQLGVNQLRVVHPDFDGFGTSAMSKSVQTGISLGRPFGGTGFLYNKKYSKCLKPLINCNHERVTTMELSTKHGRIIIINAYLPYLNSRDLQNYLSLYREVIGHIENIMTTNIGSSFILMADFNCNIFDSSHPYTAFIRDLMNKFDLLSSFECIDNFDPSNVFSRCDVKTNSFTLLDGILISRDLKPLVKNVRISHNGNNVSDHSPVELDLYTSIDEISVINKPAPLYVNWSKLSPELKTLYSQTMKENLAAIDVNYDSILHGEYCCNDNSHICSLEEYFCDIVEAVISAESVLPKTNPNIQRSFWSAELDELKEKSVECNNYWKSIGCPKSGPAFDCRKNCHFTYKLAIRRSKALAEKESNDRLYLNLLEKDGVSFWKTWNGLNKVGCSVSSRINGKTEKNDIAEEFADYFESVYDNHDTDKHKSLGREFNEAFGLYYDTHRGDDISNFYLSWSEMIDVASKVKIGKSTSGVIRPENILYGAPELMLHFHLLFNGMIQHSYVPTDFLHGVITPIVKDTKGDLADTANYRGITLSILPAKLFEFALQTKLSRFLKTDDFQFGFKQKTSSSHALFILQSTIEHFTSHGSKVYVAFLDCTKAFDRISHDGLFLKFIERGVPLCLLLCLVYWYRNMTCIVKWEGAFSRAFGVPLGIKQGGINSPDFFTCYIDDLIKLIRALGSGCHFYKILVAILLFADDMCLLAPTRSALQNLVNKCADYCERFCLNFNPKKSKVMVFSKSKIETGKYYGIYMNGQCIEYVTSIKYLGVTICSNPSFSFSASKDIANFYCSSNAILNALHKPDDCVLMHLLYTNCVPVLTYACGVKKFSSREMQDCNTALNNAIRRIFTYNRWESVRELRESLGYKSLTEIFNTTASNFFNSLSNHSNSFIREFHSHVSNNLYVD